MVVHRMLGVMAVMAVAIPIVLPDLSQRDMSDTASSAAADVAKALEAPGNGGRKAATSAQVEAGAGWTLASLVEETKPLLTGPDRRADRCLAQAVYFEARSEPLDGQLAVANVVLNRVNSPSWPNDVCAVVFQNEHWRNRCQFSFACDGLSDRPKDAGAWQTARAVSTIALAGAWPDQTGNSTHYHAVYVNPSWRSLLEPTVKHGRHLFYRHRPGRLAAAE